MNYREVPPPPALAAVVQSLWEIRGDRRLESPCVHRVLPDGCFDLVLHLGTLPSTDRVDTGLPPAGISIVGVLLRAVRLELAGDVHIVGACLRPGGVRALLDAPACELTDRIVPWTDVWGARAASIDDEVRSGDPNGALERFSTALRCRLRDPTADPVSERAVARIRRASGAVSVDALARELGVARRRLERRFAQNVGLTPKQFCRVLRFEGVVRRPRGRSWAERALVHGYHDQAHLIHEFRAFAGVTPLALEHELRASEGDSAPVANRQDGRRASR